MSMKRAGRKAKHGPSRGNDPIPRLDASRARQLASDLLLTPTQRVIAAERTARELEIPQVSPFIVSFDSFEDYFEWKRLKAIKRSRQS